MEDPRHFSGGSFAGMFFLRPPPPHTCCTSNISWRKNSTNEVRDLGTGSQRQSSHARFPTSVFYPCSCPILPALSFPLLPRSPSPTPQPLSTRHAKKEGGSGARRPPQFLKKRSENAGANENLSGGFAAIPGIAPRVAPRIVGFVLIKS